MSAAVVIGTSLTPLLFFFLALTYVVYSLTQRWKHRKIIQFMSQIPGPPALPIIGTFYIFLDQLRTMDVTRFLLDVVESFPETSRHWLNFTPYIVTTDREIVAALTSSRDNVSKAKEYESLKLISAGLFSSTGNLWRKTRRIVNPGFRTSVLDSFDENFSHHVQVFLDAVEERVKTGEEFNVFRMVHSFTLDAVIDNMLGVRLDIQKEKTYHLSRCVEKAVDMFFERSFNPLIWPDLVYSLIGKKKIMVEVSAEMRRLAEEVLNERIAHRERQRKENPTAETPQYFMELLLNGIESGEVTKQQCVEEIIELFLAGSLTSAITISWMIKGAAMYPHLSEKVYEEVMSVCGNRKITYDDLSKLTYLDMIVKETLRHCTLPVIGREITSELKVNDKMTIPPGINVLVPLFGLHHDPRYWEKPNEFYPEHFSPENEGKRPKGTFLPFSNGPRNCIGNKYAMRAMKCLLANVVLRFTVSTSEPVPKDIIHDLQYKIVFLICPKHGWNVRFHNRVHKSENPSSELTLATPA
nr:PREDICTED: cytochrome P450 4X1-like [Bemisia tabaci]